MVNFKKMDEQDFVFVNKPLSSKEEKEFNVFLQNLKLGLKVKRKLKSFNTRKKVTS